MPCVSGHVRPTLPRAIRFNALSCMESWCQPVRILDPHSGVEYAVRIPSPSHIFCVLEALHLVLSVAPPFNNSHRSLALLEWATRLAAGMALLSAAVQQTRQCCHVTGTGTASALAKSAHLSYFWWSRTAISHIFLRPHSMSVPTVKTRIHHATEFLVRSPRIQNQRTVS